MPLKSTDVIKHSLLYRSISKLLYWTKQSVTAQLLRDERVLVALFGVVLSVSIFRVLLSNMQAPIKFLSFALLFVSLVAVTWNYTEPLAGE